MQLTDIQTIVDYRPPTFRTDCVRASSDIGSRLTPLGYSIIGTPPAPIGAASAAEVFGHHTRIATDLLIGGGMQYGRVWACTAAGVS